MSSSSTSAGSPASTGSRPGSPSDDMTLHEYMSILQRELSWLTNQLRLLDDRLLQMSLRCDKARQQHRPSFINVQRLNMSVIKGMRTAFSMVRQRKVEEVNSLLAELMNNQGDVRHYEIV